MTLAERFGAGPISIRELAERNDIPKRFLEQIMLDLKAAGWVKSISGRIGGFELGARPEEITMGQIVRLFDGVIAPIGCVSLSHYESCSQEPTCRFRRVLLEIRNFSASLMDRATLASVIQRQPVSRKEVFEMTFVNGEGI